MGEHQYTQQPKKTDNTSQKQTIPPKQIPSSHPMVIIQRARINPKSLTHADVMQLQRTIGNRAVGKLLTEIGLIPSKPKQSPPVQMQPILEEEKEPLQSKMMETIQRQETPEEEEPLQGKFVEPIQCQEIPEEEEPLQGKMIGAIQRKEPEEEDKLQMKSVVQRQEKLEEEKPLQGKFENESEREACPSCSTPLIQKQEENRTGMPDNLKAGVESLSRINMSDVRVHYNSSKPAEVGALAYTQGTNIHIAPGQERHLPHEAWHVVQQAQERVPPTIQLKGVAVNDDVELEKEADGMGWKALQSSSDQGEKTLLKVLSSGITNHTPINTTSDKLHHPVQLQPVIQPFWVLHANGNIIDNNEGEWKPESKYVQIDKFMDTPCFMCKEMKGKKKIIKFPVFAEEKIAESYQTHKREEKTRVHKKTRRRDFSREEREHLHSIPHLLDREDHDLKSQLNQAGRRKAYLSERGLMAAGSTAISAAEQMDQYSKRKPEGNRISSKGPLKEGEIDSSNPYGSRQQILKIKARKLERARLRGKPDAQHVRILTPAEIKSELTGRYSPVIPPEIKQKLAFVEKDREFHHVVDFYSADFPLNFIPNRFLIRPNMPHFHDSDSESDSDTEGERAVPSTTTTTSTATPSAAAPETQETIPSGGKKKRKRKPKPPAAAATPTESVLKEEEETVISSLSPVKKTEEERAVPSTTATTSTAMPSAAAPETQETIPSGGKKKRKKKPKPPVAAATPTESVLKEAVPSVSEVDYEADDEEEKGQKK
jgi:hypothetical protein